MTRRTHTTTLPGPAPLARRPAALARGSLIAALEDVRAELPAVHGSWELVNVEVSLGWLLGLVGVPRSWQMAKVHGQPRTPLTFVDPHAPVVPGTPLREVDVAGASVPAGCDAVFHFVQQAPPTTPAAPAGAGDLDVIVVDYLELMTGPRTHRVGAAVWTGRPDDAAAAVYRGLRRQGLAPEVAHRTAGPVATARRTV